MYIDIGIYIFFIKVSSDEDDVEMIQSTIKINIKHNKNKRQNGTDKKGLCWTMPSEMGDPCLGAINPSLFSFSECETEESENEMQQIVYDEHDETETFKWKKLCIQHDRDLQKAYKTIKKLQHENMTLIEFKHSIDIILNKYNIRQ